MVYKKENLYETNELKEKIDGIIEGCAMFIKFFCNRTFENQNMVFLSFNKITHNISPDAAFIDMVNAIFRGNKKLAEENVEDVIDLFVKLVEIYGKRAKFLE